MKSGSVYDDLLFFAAKIRRFSERCKLMLKKFTENYRLLFGGLGYFLLLCTEETNRQFLNSINQLKT